MGKRNLHMIEELLERYFEGETSAAEEKQIRAFFASGEVPEHLAAYAPLFAYFDEEIERDAEAQVGEPDLDPEPVSVPFRSANRKRAALYLFSGVAACVLALLGVTRLLYPADLCFCSDSYVSDKRPLLIPISIKFVHWRSKRWQEVATPADDYFPEMDKDEADRRIIDNQLKELGSLFSEDE